MRRREDWALSVELCGGVSHGAARDSAAPAAPVPEAAPAALSFGEQVAALPEGSTQYFAESPFGQATLDAGPLYLSGLGNECRLIRVTRGTASYQLTLCKENGTWRFIPSIFEGMPQ